MDKRYGQSMREREKKYHSENVRSLRFSRKTHAYYVHLYRNTEQAYNLCSVYVYIAKSLSGESIKTRIFVRGTAGGVTAVTVGCERRRKDRSFRVGNVRHPSSVGAAGRLTVPL